MALQKKQAEYAKLKEATDLQAESQRGEVHAKQVEQQEALQGWMQKQEQRKQLLEEAARIESKKKVPSRTPRLPTPNRFPDPD